MLRRVLKRFRPTASSRVGARINELSTLWKKVVGSDLSGWTQVMSYRNGIMTVQVHSAPLVAELQAFAKKELLEELRESGLEEIRELRFRTR